MTDLRYALCDCAYAWELTLGLPWDRSHIGVRNESGNSEEVAIHASSTIGQQNGCASGCTLFTK